MPINWQKKSQEIIGDPQAPTNTAPVTPTKINWNKYTPKNIPEEKPLSEPVLRPSQTDIQQPPKETISSYKKPTKLQEITSGLKRTGKQFYESMVTDRENRPKTPIGVLENVARGTIDVVSVFKKALTEPTKNEIMLMNEGDRLAYLREKKKQETFKKEGVQKVPTIPADYKEPTGLIDTFNEGLRSSYENTKAGLAGTLESVGHIIGSSKTGLWADMNDRTRATIAKHPEWARPSDLKEFAKGGWKDPRWYARTAGELLPSLAGALGGAVLGGITGGPAGAYAGAFGATKTMEQGNAYNSMLDAGIAPDEAARAADIYSTISGVIEMGFGNEIRIANKVISPAQTTAVKNNFKTFLLKELPVEMGRTTLSEGTEEYAQQLTQNLITRYLDENQDITAGLTESFFAGAFGGLLFGSVEAGNDMINSGIVQAFIDKNGIVHKKTGNEIKEIDPSTLSTPEFNSLAKELDFENQKIVSNLQQPTTPNDFITPDVTTEKIDGLSPQDAWDKIYKVPYTVVSDKIETLTKKLQVVTDETEQAKIKEALTIQQQFAKQLEENFATAYSEKAPEVVATPAEEKKKEDDAFMPKADFKKRAARMDVKDLEAEITNRIDAFRQQADLMASKEGAGVRLREGKDAVGQTTRVFSDFNEDRAKADMFRDARGKKQYAKQLLYENDEAFRAYVDEYDKKIGSAVTELVEPELPDFGDLEDTLKTVNEEINNINEYEKQAQQTSEKEADGVQKDDRTEVEQETKQLASVDEVLADIGTGENAKTIFEKAEVADMLFSAEDALEKTIDVLNERSSNVNEIIENKIINPINAKIESVKSDIDVYKKAKLKQEAKDSQKELEKLQDIKEKVLSTVENEFVDFSLALRDILLKKSEERGIADREVASELVDEVLQSLEYPYNGGILDEKLSTVFNSILDDYANKQTERGGERSEQPDTGPVSDIVSAAFSKPSVAGGADTAPSQLPAEGFSRNDAGVIGERPATHLSPEQRDRELAYNGKGGLVGAEGRGVLDEYFTPFEVIKKMWGLAAKFGFTGGDVLEPSAGIGRFFEYAPENASLTAIELDLENARKIKALFPHAKVIGSPFEDLFVEDNGKPKKFKPAYDLVIGNPPYGTHRAFYKNLGEEPKIADLESYFIKRGLDLLREDGLLIYIVPSSFMRSKVDYAKKEIAKIGNLIEAYRLPNGLFTGTNVGTDILVFKKQGGVITAEMLSDDNHFKIFKDNVLGEAGEIRGRFGMEPGVIGDINALEKIEVPAVEKIKPLTQKDLVKEAVSGKAKSIKEIAKETGILEPNIRRILGVGEKEGVFSRVDKGVYILKKDGKDIAFIHTGDAVETLPKLAADGFKADMVFLDIPYDTPAVKGGNRGAEYNLISTSEFQKVVNALDKIVRDENTPVFYMYSQAKSGLKKMEVYNQIILDAGFKPVARGEYTKLQKDGITRTRNMRGEVDYPEAVVLMNKSGQFEAIKDEDLRFQLIRPKGYQTEKPAEMLKQMIEMATNEGDIILDPFAGSGVTGAEAIKAGRVPVLIEKSPNAVENYIKPRLEEAAKLESGIKAFHGTNKRFSKFSKEFIGENQQSDWGNGFYFTDKRSVAESFAKDAGGDIVMEVSLDIKNPAKNKDLLDRDIQDAIDDEMGFKDVGAVLREKGFDGIEYTHKDGSKEYVVFDENQIAVDSGEKQSTLIQSAREAAKEMIRAYVERGDSIESLKSGQMGVFSEDFGAQIGGYLNGKKLNSNKIGVERVGTTIVNKVFDLKELYDEIKTGVSKEVKPKVASLFDAPVQQVPVAASDISVEVTTKAKPKHLDMRDPVSNDEVYSLHTQIDGSLDEDTPEELLSMAPAMTVGGQIKRFSPYNYYQGDIYQKLDQAALDASTGAITASQHEKQVAGLRAILPTKIDIRSSSIAPNSRFVEETMVPIDDGQITLRDLFVRYLKEVPREAFSDSSLWEVTGFLNGNRVSEGDKELNMKVKNRRREVAQRLFDDFIAKDLTKDQLMVAEDKFNRLFNGYVHANTLNVPILSSHSKKFKGKDLHVQDHQKTAVGFLVNKGAGLLAHDVGAGKTMSAILAVNETMARGYSKRPLFVVPNQVYSKWISEIKELLPGAKINELKNLGSKVVVPKIEDNTITVMAYEGLTNLGLKPENFDRITSELSDNLLSDAAKSERSKQAEAQKAEAMAGKAARGTEVFLEDLGIDLLTIDEVHNFKNIFTGAKISKEQGGARSNEYANVRGSSSNRGVKMYYLTQQILSKNNNRNVFALSATPFVNNPLEIYSILSLFGRYKLQQKGITNVNDFMTNFMNLQNKHVVKATGKVELQDVIEEYKNLQPLQDIVREFIDFKGSEELKLARPNKNRRIAKIGFSEKQIEYTEQAQELFNNKEAGPLVAITEMQNITLSPYLSRYYDGGAPSHTEFVEKSPKVKYAVDHIIEMSKQADKIGEAIGQVIFMPRGVEYFELIAKYLVENGGYKKNEIAFIKSGVTAEEKYEIAEAFNSNKVKVVIGSDSIKEGIDLNKNATDLYYLHLPWNPTDMIQAEGRIWRQGNQWANVRIHYPLIENSVDSFLFQKVETKSKRIQNVWSYKGNVMNVADINPEELKLELITDPVRRVEAEFAFKQFNVDNNLRTLKSEKSLNAGAIEAIKEFDNDIAENTKAMNDPENSEWAKNYYDEKVKEAQQKKTALMRKIVERGIDLKQMAVVAKEFDDKIAIAEAEVEKTKREFSASIDKALLEKPTSLAISEKNTDLISGFVEQTRKENPDFLTKFESKVKKVAPGSASATDVFGDTELTKEAWTNAPELVALANELMGHLPRINTRLRVALGKAVGVADIQLRPDIFKDPALVSKVLAHEIGHIAHNMPPNIKPSTLLRKLTVLDIPRKELPFSTKKIKEELWTLSNLWRPATDESDMEYRKSSAELYADFMSVLLNRPDLAEQYAPTFFDNWHEYIENKPEVKEAYIDFRKMMAGDWMSVHLMREEILDEDLKTAKEQDSIIQGEKRARGNFNFSSIMNDLAHKFLDRKIGVYKASRKALAEGNQINPEDRPELLIQDVDFLVNTAYEINEMVRPVEETYKNGGVSDEEFSKFNFYKRVLGDRSALGNPHGHNPISAQQELDAYAKLWGEEKYQAAEQASAMFQKVYKTVFKEGYEADLYDTELFSGLYNDQGTYVRFDVLDHRLETFVSAAVVHQVGTLKGIGNTFQATVARMIAIKYASAKNRAKRALAKTLATITESGEFEMADVNPETGYVKTKKDRGTIVWREKGGLKAAYVDPYIADAFNHDTELEKVLAIEMLKFVQNNTTRKLFIDYSVRFLVRNPFRDFQKAYAALHTWEDLQGTGKMRVTLPQLFKNYVMSWKDARAFAKKEYSESEIVTEMLNEKILKIDTEEDITPERMEEMSALERELAKHFIDLKKPEVRGRLRKVAEWIKRVQQTFESITKISAYRILKDRLAQHGKVPDKETGAYIRNNVGTPNYLRGGKWTPNTNVIAQFSNITLQGYRSTYEVAVQNPNTRTGYRWALAKTTLLPKTLLFLAGIGAFGDELEKKTKRISRYTKMNFLTVPIPGTDYNLHLPQDYDQRLIGAIYYLVLEELFSKGSKNVNDPKFKEYAQLIHSAFPTLSALFTIPAQWSQFAMGRNPMDDYRGRPVLTESEFAAAQVYPMDGIVPMLKTTWNNIFGGIYKVDVRPRIVKNESFSFFTKLPGINAFITDDDFGNTEEYMRIAEDVRGEMAHELLAKQKDVVGAANDFLKGKGTYEEIFNRLRGEVYGGQEVTTVKLTNLNKQFVEKIVLGKYPNPEYSALVYARTRDEQIMLIKKYRQELPAKELNEIGLIMTNAKIISVDTWNEAFSLQ